MELVYPVVDDWKMVPGLINWLPKVARFLRVCVALTSRLNVVLRVLTSAARRRNLTDQHQQHCCRYEYDIR